MKRTILEELKIWSNSNNRKPIILRGARQVGKTYSINEFANKFFDNIFIVDFEQDQFVKSIFTRDLNPKRIISELELHYGSKITPGKTLLFFDEVQMCPKAIMSLRYFYEQMSELHVIAAGSLLEFAINDISFPVGRVQYMHMYPLSFYEFLLALGKNMLAEIIINKPQELSELIHNDLTNYLKQYFFVGGMPEAVKTYINSNSFYDTFAVHKNLTKSIIDDFSKYAPKIDKFCMQQVFLSCIKNVGKQIKYTHLTEDFSIPIIKKTLDCLYKAQVIKKITAVNPPELPFGACSLNKIFKFIGLDIGIMQHLSGLSPEIEYKKEKLLSIYQGALAEQFIGQELCQLFENKVYYWSRQAKSSSAEIDYISAIQGKVIPIEVKNGSSGKLRSMHLFLKTYKHSPYGIVFYDGKYSELPEQKLLFYPLYYVQSAFKK